MSPVTRSSIGAYIREQRELAGKSIRQLAENAGVSNPYLSQVERGLRRPSADILQQIAKGLRISAEALYVQAGILDDRPTATAVPEAIRADPELTERQKQMLVEIYESFRKEVTLDSDDDPPEPDVAVQGDGWPFEDVLPADVVAAEGLSDEDLPEGDLPEGDLPEGNLARKGLPGDDPPGDDPPGDDPPEEGPPQDGLLPEGPRRDAAFSGNQPGQGGPATASAGTR